MQLQLPSFYLISPSPVSQCLQLIFIIVIVPSLEVIQSKRPLEVIIMSFGSKKKMKKKRHIKIKLLSSLFIVPLKRQSRLFLASFSSLNAPKSRFIETIYLPTMPTPTPTMPMPTMPMPMPSVKRTFGNRGPEVNLTSLHLIYDDHSR